MYQHILVPVDDSVLAVSLATQAVAFARTLGARITFFHARGDYAATSDGALLHALAPEEFAEHAPGPAQAVLARAEAEARLAGVASDSVIRTSDRPYEAIVDAALERGCDLIFMASHGRKGWRGLLIGSQTAKVLGHSTVPVLVSTVEANAPSREMEAAVAVIKGEHRSMAAVVHALKQAFGQARGLGKPADAEWLRGAVQYFRRFTLGMHHPKEDAYLFACLKARSTSMDALLETLQTQHAEEVAFIDALDAAVEAYVATPQEESLGGLEQALDRYAERLWEHMRLEEKFVLPACQAHLDQDDWHRIAQAFEANGDPRFDLDKSAGFERLFLRLVSTGT
ncbi:universal stress protein [Thauera linaloolentis]|uniref:UspA domain containing protein n=1 Tax=Thauera linaloolentis (strain DSM 12138 / JCM 21573 / CCUG 41526 / CIP 105981 / IAM 15112 / NBRC 102519 / 47Lol) TaxID=1123367 RepID=N6Y1Z9_THAL4|nr:universal stress protein [Thauera linaloolentis]ENO85570.1 UspA domain containing protein [Thauera linaloolentis 47Lol = DSM 12138]MCM8566534.1 universal stress protein [Thauera linaloolentis]